MSLPYFGIHVLIDDRKEIVACYACDLHSLKSVLFCDLNALLSCGYGVSASHVGDELDLTIDCVDSTASSAVAGDILEAKAGQTTLTRVAAATGATADTTAFEIEYVGVAPFPQAGIGMEQVTMFRVRCIQA